MAGILSNKTFKKNAAFEITRQLGGVDWDPYWYFKSFLSEYSPTQFQALDFIQYFLCQTDTTLRDLQDAVLSGSLNEFFTTNMWLATFSLPEIFKDYLAERNLYYSELQELVLSYLTRSIQLPNLSLQLNTVTSSHPIGIQIPQSIKSIDFGSDCRISFIEGLSFFTDTTGNSFGLPYPAPYKALVDFGKKAFFSKKDQTTTPTEKDIYAKFLPVNTLFRYLIEFAADLNISEILNQAEDGAVSQEVLPVFPLESAVVISIYFLRGLSAETIKAYSTDIAAGYWLGSPPFSEKHIQNVRLGPTRFGLPWLYQAKSSRIEKDNMMSLVSMMKQKLVEVLHIFAIPTSVSIGKLDYATAEMLRTEISFKPVLSGVVSQHTGVITSFQV